MPSADQLAAVGLIITALSGFVTAIGTLRNSRKLQTATDTAKDTADKVDETTAKVADLHAEVASPNGSSTGQAIADIHHDLAQLTAQVGQHLADGHGGPITP